MAARHVFLAFRGLEAWQTMMTSNAILVNIMIASGRCAVPLLTSRDCSSIFEVKDWRALTLRTTSLVSHSDSLHTTSKSLPRCVCPKRFRKVAQILGRGVGGCSSAANPSLMRVFMQPAQAPLGPLCIAGE